MEHRPDPNNLAGAEARRKLAAARRARVQATAEMPWPRFLAGIALRLGLLFVGASVLVWLLSLARGY